MTVQELKRLIDENEDIIIIDIRENYECEDGAICEVNIPLAQFMSRINELPKGKPVVLYCNSGKRAHESAKILHKNGFNNKIYIITNGGYHELIDLVKQKNICQCKCKNN